MMNSTEIKGIFENSGRISNGDAVLALATIESCYPGLLRYEDGIYLGIKGISSEPLEYNTSIIYDGSLKCISFFGKDFEFNLFWDDSYGHSSLNMHYDFELPLEACMALYAIDVDITYNVYGIGVMEGRVSYDRTSIERRGIIKEIINYVS